MGPPICRVGPHDDIIILNFLLNYYGFIVSFFQSLRGYKICSFGQAFAVELNPILKGRPAFKNHSKSHNQCLYRGRDFLLRAKNQTKKFKDHSYLCYSPKMSSNDFESMLSNDNYQLLGFCLIRIHSLEISNQCKNSLSVQFKQT